MSPVGNLEIAALRADRIRGRNPGRTRYVSSVSCSSLTEFKIETVTNKEFEA